MNKVYLIVWEGRDDESGVWDVYPCWEFGFFTNKTEAEKFALYMDNHEPFEYDEDAEMTPGYSVKTLEKHKEE